MIADVSNEGIIVGCLYNEPDLFMKYSELINDDDFTDKFTKFMYYILHDIYIHNSKINKTLIQLYTKDFKGEDRSIWKKTGLKTLTSLSKIAESVTIEHAYNKLKAYTVLRYLNNNNINTENDVEVLKDMDVHDIINKYDDIILKASNKIKGTDSSILIGDDIVETYNEIKRNPDIGETLPHNNINTFIRGWRLQTLNAIAMHSGYGKSRFIVHMLCHTSIFNKLPVLLCVNEQEKKEIELMILTCVANNMFAKDYGFTISETNIALGNIQKDADKMLNEAAKYIENNSQIHFLEMSAWDLDTIKMILKMHKIKGINHVIIDTFKAMRGIDTKLNDWQQYVYTAETLKSLIGSEKKKGLNMSVWLTLQLTDDSLNTNILNSTSLATGKQIKHHLDFLAMFRPMSNKELKNILIKTNNSGNLIEPDTNSLYYMCMIDKNRGGQDKQKIIFKVDKGKMVFNELGFIKIKNKGDSL